MALQEQALSREATLKLIKSYKQIKGGYNLQFHSGTEKLSATRWELIRKACLGITQPWFPGLEGQEERDESGNLKVPCLLCSILCCPAPEMESWSSTTHAEAKSQDCVMCKNRETVNKAKQYTDNLHCKTSSSNCVKRCRLKSAART